MKPTLKTQRVTAAQDSGVSAEQIETLRLAIVDYAREVGTIELLAGSSKRDIALVASTAVIVYHGLGRLPIGWLVTRATTSAPVLYETGRDDKTLTLMPGNTGTIDLWIY